MDHLVRSYCAGSEGEAEVAAEGQRKQKDGSSGDGDGGGCTVIVKCDASKGEEEESQSLPAKTSVVGCVKIAVGASSRNLAFVFFVVSV